MNKSLIISLVGALAAPPGAAGATTFIAGEFHRTTAVPSAAVRDAQHRTELRITIWYPAADGAVARPIVIGPPQQPIFHVGSATIEAPFVADAAGRLRPVILLSHGFGGTAEVMGWFGMAMAEAGYIVISVDHPGNNALDLPPQNCAGNGRPRFFARGPRDVRDGRWLDGRRARGWSRLTSRLRTADLETLPLSGFRRDRRYVGA